MLKRLLFVFFPFFQVTVGASQNASELGSTQSVLDQTSLGPLPLGTLAHHTFTTLTHPNFPNHSVRVKKSKFCDGNVSRPWFVNSAYTGYIDVEARHLFFYLFESRRDPAQDDVIFWTNGGPGGSSAFGLFMELGPCRMTENGTLVYHPESWNEYANIFFIDQPIGVGFSYADHGETVSTTPEAAKDIASFVTIFFEHFTQFKGNRFHLAGESYGGRFIPVFGAEILDHNEKLIQAGMEPINLASIMIGNGYSDPVALIKSRVTMQCTSVSGLPPILPISDCVRLHLQSARCEKWIQKSCVDVLDAMACQAASDYCGRELSSVLVESKRNPYDLSKVCNGIGEEDMCYAVSRNVREYLDLPSTRSLLGVDPSFTKNFSMIAMSIQEAFGRKFDEFDHTPLYVAQLLERSVRVLVYAGTYDLVCDWIGNDRWTKELRWSGRETFASQPLFEWTMEGRAVGQVRSANGLTFVSIYKAGHLAPYDNPKESLEMVRRWLVKEF